MGRQHLRRLHNAWQDVVLEHHHMTHQFQDARWGRPIASWAENYTRSGGVYTRKMSTTHPASKLLGTKVGGTLSEEVADVDLMLIQLGTNKLAGEPIGTVDDVAGSATTAGHIKEIIEALQTANPNMRIMWITPYRTPPGLTDVEYDNVRAVTIAICGRYGVAVIDMGQLAGISPITWKSLTMDLIHPNKAGFRRYGSIIARQMTAFGGK